MNNIISIGDGELYLLYRVLNYKEGIDVGVLKKMWKCDSTFKKEGKLYVCRHIPEIEYEEIEENENQLCDPSMQ